jgi:hypothetical protein
MSLEHRPARFLSLRFPTQAPSVCDVYTASKPHPLRIFMRSRANFDNDNARVLNWIQIAANAPLGATWRNFSKLRTLLPSPKEQVPYCHRLAHSSFALSHKSENQLLCFHAGAHSFVNMWGWRAPELRYPPRRARNQYLQPARSMFCLPSPQFSGTLPRPSPPRGGRKRDPGGTR